MQCWPFKDKEVLKSKNERISLLERVCKSQDKKLNDFISRDFTSQSTCPEFSSSDPHTSNKVSKGCCSSKIIISSCGNNIESPNDKPESERLQKIEEDIAYLKTKIGNPANNHNPSESIPGNVNLVLGSSGEEDVSIPDAHDHLNYQRQTSQHSQLRL